MRDGFFKAVEDLSEERDNIYILTADLGFGLFDKFRNKYPERFYDIGVAEANMIGIASGLALSGKNVYCYSIIPFLVMRAFEQIRIDIAYQNLNVKLIGAGGGFTYGLEGFTHFALEDLALMRVLPNMTVVVPCDYFEAQEFARLSYDYNSPIYIRLGRNNEPNIHQQKPNIKIGEGLILTQGNDLAIFSIGSMISVALDIHDILGKHGLWASVVNMHTLKPLDEKLIKRYSEKYKAIFTIEEHYISGGLGSAVAEVLAENSYSGIFKRFGIPLNPKKTIGNAELRRNFYGLNAKNISDDILEVLKNKNTKYGNFA